MKYLELEKFEGEAFNWDLTGNILDIIIMRRHFGFQVHGWKRLWFVIQTKENVYFFTIGKQS